MGPGGGWRWAPCPAGSRDVEETHPGGKQFRAPLMEYVVEHGLVET
jgi:hypothetical protein